MSFCILCLKPTKRSKITLNELIIDKTVKEVIIEQFSNHELILTGSSSTSQAICPTCCKHFKDFYNFKKDINQKLSEVTVKVEEVPVNFVNFVLIEEPVLDYDLKQLEISIERVKTEPKDIEQYVREFKEIKVEDQKMEEMEDSDFEWRLEDDDWHVEEESENPPIEKSKPPLKKKPKITKDQDIAEQKPSTLKTKKKGGGRTGRPPKSPEVKAARIKKFADLKCPECNTENDSYLDYRTHFQKEHPNVEFYIICCYKRYSSTLGLLRHLDVHDKTKDIPCEVCGKAFVSIYRLRSHAASAHEGKRKKEEIHICSLCGKVLKSSSTFRKHMMTHEEDERTFECYKCQSIHKNQHYLKKHFQKVHTPKREIFKTCHICQLTLPHKRFSYHMDKVHKGKFDEKEQCKVCERWITKAVMKHHMKIHEDPGKTCEICGKFLRKSSTYNSHKKLVHRIGVQTTFECGFCDRTFARDLKLIEHTASVHTREYPWICRVRRCGREFRSESNWQAHEREAHPEIYEKYLKPDFKRDPDEPRPDQSEAARVLIEGRSYTSDPGVNCDVCGKYLRLTSWLQKHKNDFHTDSLPKFCCTLCDAKFNQQQDLEDHIESAHTKEIVVRCRVEGCGRGFSTRFSWKRHEMTVHPEEYAMMGND